MKAANKNIQLTDNLSEVSVQEKTFLIRGSRKVPIRTDYASKYSLSFHYLENQPFIDPDKPVNLLIKNNGRSVEVGPCRIITGHGINGYPERLVFLDEVYDFQNLIKHHKVVKLQGLFSDLPQVIERKNKIKPPFKDYVANLVYDLRAYKQVFDRLDSDTNKEPDAVKWAVQEAIIRTEGAIFRKFLQNTIEELIHQINGFSTAEHQRHGFYFRSHLWEFILSCPFAARANLKPRGYPGDSGQMRMIYRNDYQGSSTFAKLLHKHAVEHAASQSVRNRIKLIPQLIKDYVTNSQTSEFDNIKVLSVGSGAAFELKDIYKSPRDCSKFNFVLFDQDPVALKEAADLAAEIEDLIGASPKIDFIEGSVRTMLFSHKIMKPWGKFDFIYSMGLFDYLNSRVARAVLKRLYQFLKPGGKMVVGNFSTSNPSRYYMEYWGDWVLIHRTEKELKRLFSETSSADVRIDYDETGCQMFLVIEKDSALQNGNA
jgi:extracellular factor (EF) 3-hydroxypalmitic acid methyl ester biosynthesis protein